MNTITLTWWYLGLLLWCCWIAGFCVASIFHSHDEEGQP